MKLSASCLEYSIISKFTFLLGGCVILVIIDIFLQDGYVRLNDVLESIISFAILTTASFIFFILVETMAICIKIRPKRLTIKDGLRVGNKIISSDEIISITPRVYFIGDLCYDVLLMDIKRIGEIYILCKPHPIPFSQKNRRNKTLRLLKDRYPELSKKTKSKYF